MVEFPAQSLVKYGKIIKYEKKGSLQFFYHLVNVIVGPVLGSIINRRTVLRLLQNLTTLF